VFATQHGEQSIDTSPMEKTSFSMRRRSAAHTVPMKTVDLSHNCFTESYWKPIKRVEDPLPPDNYLRGPTINLKERELDQYNEYAKYMYDRRIVDGEVMRRYRENGDIVSMCVDHRELTKDVGFWKSEEEIRKLAYLHIRELKKIRAYDLFNMQPDSYNVKGDNKAENEGKKPQAAKSMKEVPKAEPKKGPKKAN
jgi:hypothetical protein